jgi:membrane fusion protein, copper/silver efflux system
VRRGAIALALVAAACSRGGAPADDPDPHAGHGAAAAPADPHAGHAAPPAADPHAGHAAPPAADPRAAPGQVPADLAEVTIAPDRQQRIGLTLGRAELAAVGGVIRATGVVRTDERREAHVHPRIAGWVEKAFVAAEGQTVKKGQPLYSIYSQELLVAQQDYLRARRASPELAEASRERLRLLDVPDSEIERIEAGGASRAITIRAPIGGTVLARDIQPGQYVGPELRLYWIADLSRLWLVADVYEYELDRLDRAATAVITIAGSDRPRQARIDHVYPTVDPQSRTARVRLLLDNRDRSLRPGAFATVLLPARRFEVLSVPEEAVIDTGVRQVVFVHLGEGRFRPVAVEVGRRGGGRAEIRAGLAAGDPVVVSGQFLLDSESRLRAAPTAPGHGGH